MWYIPKQGCENENKEELTCWHILGFSQSFWILQEVNIYKGLVKRKAAIFPVVSNFNRMKGEQLWGGRWTRRVSKALTTGLRQAPSKTAAVVGSHRRPWYLPENRFPPSVSHTTLALTAHSKPPGNWEGGGLASHRCKNTSLMNVVSSHQLKASQHTLPILAGNGGAVREYKYTIISGFREWSLFLTSVTTE